MWRNVTLSWAQIGANRIIHCLWGETSSSWGGQNVAVKWQEMKINKYVSWLPASVGNFFGEVFPRERQNKKKMNKKRSHHNCKRATRVAIASEKQVAEQILQTSKKNEQSCCGSFDKNTDLIKTITDLIWLDRREQWWSGPRKVTIMCCEKAVVIKRRTRSLKS